MPRRKQFSAQEVIDAIHQTKGNIRAAANLLDTSRTTLYNYINKYPTVAQAKDDAKEDMLDWVEGKLYALIAKENPAAIFFFLKTQGKGRGYVERSELQHSGVVQWQEFIKEAREEIDDSSDPYA